MKTWPIVIVISLLSSLNVFATNPSATRYFGNGFNLQAHNKDTLNKAIANNSNMTYTQVRNVIFKSLDLKKDNRGYYIHDIYCSTNFYADSFDHGEAPSPNSVPAPDIMNVEHTWPQSRFSLQFNKDLQKTDLHHLYPSNSETNATRGNYMFAEVNGEDDVRNCQTASMGSNIRARDGKTYFQPPKEHRGNVARALFYFSVRYRLTITPEEEFFLRKWHREDPVDAEEIARHEEIFKIQRNRNPFIDYPELVEKIDNF